MGFSERVYTWQRSGRKKQRERWVHGGERNSGEEKGTREGLVGEEVEAESSVKMGSLQNENKMLYA